MKRYSDEEITERCLIIFTGMVARTMLAALDNNHNADRPYAKIKAGERSGEKRYNVVFPKGRKRWVAKPVKEKKDYRYVQDMMMSVVRVCEGTATAEETAEIRVPELPSNISRNEKPSKEDVVSTQKSRMQIR